jgi:hypothetical protein
MSFPEEEDEETKEEHRQNFLKKLQYIKCFTKKGCNLKYYNEEEMHYLQSAILRSTKDSEFLSKYYGITKLEYERFYFKNELQIPIMHLYTDYL